MALTLVDFKEILFDSSSSPRASASMTWNDGDLFIIIGGIADSGESRTLSTPTATGLTFDPIGSALAGASHCWGHRWQETASGSGSSTISITRNGTAAEWGAAIAQYRGHNGVGGNNSAQADGFQVSNTNTGTNSMVIWYGFDWDALAAGVTLTPATNLTERRDQQVSPTSWSVFGGTWTGQNSGATTYGIDTDHGERLTQFVIEVLEGTEGGGGGGTPRLRGATRSGMRLG